jgi:hypothetical protein
MSAPFDYELSITNDKIKTQPVLKYSQIEYPTSDIVNLELDFPETYIDSIIDNYKNLGVKPFVSILSVSKDLSNNVYVYAMYSSLTEQCYINNVIKHGKYCKCSNIKYEKFIITSDLNILYFKSYDYEPFYIEDLSNLILDVVKHYNFV